jgi:hypothetical protein
VINTWRSPGAATKMKVVWESINGQPADKKEHPFGRLPPRALKGRWGSISRSENAILEVGMGLAMVYKRAWPLGGAFNNNRQQHDG